MRKEIPAKVEIFCDVCKEEIVGKNATHKGRIQISQNTFDMNGDCWGRNAVGLDLCDPCFIKIRDYINALPEKAG